MAMTEFIDIFPTLCELCNLEIPETVEGKSLVPLLENPQAEWTDYVICKYFDGLSIVTPEYAYTEWRNANDSLISAMLYDHMNDREESNNISDDTESIEIRKKLNKELLDKRGKNYFKENKMTSNE
jgi:arylsulfatase A-like enzyme